MGSYLSIHNDTQDVVLVKIGDDEEAVRIAGLASTAVAAVALAVTGLGLAAGAMTGGLLTITASTTLAATGTALSLANVTKTVTTEIRNAYQNNGYRELRPGETLTSDKKTLSLWQQCHVVRVRTEGDGTVVQEDTYMRPIFTGATDNSNIQHDISFWTKKYPYGEKFRIRPSMGNQGNPNRGMANIAFPPGNYVWTSHHGTKLRCNPDGRVDLAPHALEHEQWQPIWKGENKYVWKSYHGTYLRANQDGTVDAATRAREWEEWQFLKYPEGNVWRSHHGTFLSARPDGYVCTMPHFQAWEYWR